jgi:ribosomal protein S18 acetylase RimI-like enzyme
MSEFTIRSLKSADRDWVIQCIFESWGSEIVIAHNEIYHPADLPGFAAFAGDQAIGLITYHIEGNACEIVTLDSWSEGQGVGTALIEAAKQAARRGDCKRLWLVTTNDNTHALRFYQKHGFVIAAFHVNAIEKSRFLKPEIPLTGADGIPIRDEIELEMSL